MMPKDYSIEGVIKLLPVEEPQLEMMVAMEGSDSVFIVSDQTEQDILDKRVRINVFAGVAKSQSRVAISELRKIVVEYQKAVAWDLSVPQACSFETAQLPLDSDQWKYVLSHKMIGADVRFETMSKKGYDKINGVTFGEWEARIVIGKQLFTDEELIELGEACYNFRIQQEQSKTNVSFREWFKSKFL